MTFVEKKVRLFSVHFQADFRLFNDLFRVGNARRNGVQQLEMAVGVFGDDVCKRGFPRPRRSVKNAAAQFIRAYRPAKQRPFADQVLLPDKLRQIARAHTLGKRRGFLNIDFACVIKQIHRPPQSVC